MHVIFNIIDTADERFTLLKPHQIPLARRLEALESDFDALKDTQGRWKYWQMLEEREVEFIERFERRGERVQWIPKDESPEHKSTNDFVWLSNGETVCELKCTSGNYRTIRDHICDAVKDARKHGVSKDVFIIDRAHVGISKKLMNQLRQYNQRNPQYKICRLFVMYANGKKFIELELR